MNNLLIKTAEFMFIPESILATSFLFIFVAIFAAGFFFAKNCRKSVEEFRTNGKAGFEKIQSKMSPDLFIKKFVNKISAKDSILDGLPDIFVNVGIIATFLGLGVAIQSSMDLLSADKMDLNKLAEVLAVIAFKFQTSVWGVCFSLIFRRAVVERYFEFRQESIDFIHSSLYETDRENIRTLLERQNEILSVQFQKQNENTTFLVDFFDKLQQQSQEENKKIFGELNDLFKNQHEELISKLALNQNALTLELRRTTGIISNSIEDNKNSITAEITAQNNLLTNEVKKTAELMLQKITEVEKNLRADNQQTSGNLIAIVENFNKVENLVAEFAENEKNFEATAQNFSNRVESFSKQLTNILHAEIADLRAVNETMIQKQDEHINKIQEEHRLNIFHVTEKLEELHRKFYIDSRKFVEESTQAFTDLSKNTVGEIQDKYLHSADDIRVSIQNLNHLLTEIKNIVDTSNSEFFMEQKNFTANRQAVMNEISKMLEVIFSTMSTETERSKQIHNSLQNAVADLKKINHDNAEISKTVLQIFQEAAVDKS